MQTPRFIWILATLLLVSWRGFASGQEAPDLESRLEAVPDYLTFARGAVPLAPGSDAGPLKTEHEQALAAIDGNPASYVLTPKPGGPETVIELIYELPAATTFSWFGVPGISETPSPSQTFVARIDVFGSAEGPDGAFVPLGGADLATHAERGQISGFKADAAVPVRWVKVALSGGIDVQRDKTFFEFSEIIGHGQQEAVPMSERFNGKWKGRGVLMELRQDGALVTGCYERSGELSGAVDGSMLYATGVDRDDGVVSAFVLTVSPDGVLNGVGSTNGAPFRRYGGDPAPEGTVTGCSETADVALGCGSIVYGIQFKFDSAAIRPGSEQVLAELFDGLQAEPGMSIVIEGHTSSEGSDSYNQELSERRAEAVVDALVARGLDPGRIAAVGRGESKPIAANDDEAGRALNRRVEVACAAPGA
jgi:outer membrane protein OmpA-like peptidoglycan-associated protein